MDHRLAQDFSAAKYAAQAAGSDPSEIQCIPTNSHRQVHPYSNAVLQHPEVNEDYRPKPDTLTALFGPLTSDE